MNSLVAMVGNDKNFPKNFIQKCAFNNLSDPWRVGFMRHFYIKNIRQRMVELGSIFYRYKGEKILQICETTNN
jgi:hypothetical protein